MSLGLSVLIMTFGLLPLALLPLTAKVRFPKTACYLGGILFGMGSVCFINALSL